jgi:hypothetical protein
MTKCKTLRTRENASYPIQKKKKQTKTKAGKKKERKQPVPIDVGVSKGQFRSSYSLGFHSHIGFEYVPKVSTSSAMTLLYVYNTNFRTSWALPPSPLMEKKNVSESSSGFRVRRKAFNLKKKKTVQGGDHRAKNCS